ncbi:amylo-alpha-1,6-glucosidase [Brachybacterium halotolerans subsp. kimchii]|uniref:MGH1-like glycoside hydrolase domain-containing protein n=1 Tax=Brachybacterium halotolerans TaxID=2795215 RepID=UPI001E49ED65|nr:glycogen debranching N-terminal domain-containing protein [Brachybacterium halotolerans]UEJ81773.1 amylo-alpha-1,6-glucosidase [Brachybacterium halotolerans subsp. kimchii]
MSTHASSPSPSAPRQVENHQPFLHDLAVVLRAPLQAWSAPDGTITGAGAQGIYLGDARVVSDLTCEVEERAENEDEDEGHPTLSPLPAEMRSAHEVVFRWVVTAPDLPGDPLVVLERTRTASGRGIRETLRLRNDDDRPRTLSLRLGLVTDSATMSQVKDPRLMLAQAPARPVARIRDGAARWRIGERGEAVLHASTGTGTLVPDVDGPVVTWRCVLEAPARGTAEADWELALTDPDVPFEAAEPRSVALTAAPDADPERRAARDLLARSLADLDALRLQVPGDPARSFAAAGAPWFFTLFGRDSLIAASLALPVDTTLAEGTLRTLASMQGTRIVTDTAEQPGKILHEVRAQGMEMAESHLPPVYFGTIDATPLWIELLHDALDAGLDATVLTDLLPHLEAAARWLLEHADADGDGLLEYIYESGHGLANQGWKDSDDSIRRADGSLASGAIALAEVQGYAYAAARHAADLLERGGSTGPSSAHLPDCLRTFATRLREAFHARFWCEDARGRYPALALDGAERPVDGVASNMGHLLATGLLDADQERLVVDRLMDPPLFSGFGIRTLSTDNGGYGPLRYHGGSVWTHDTGYILRGMLRAGFEDEARVLARGLLRAADSFDQRLPELFGGQSADEVSAPLPYPASCRPQAWAAASAVPVAGALDVL